MSKWSERVKRALRDRQVLDGIAQVATAWMEEHINENYGRGAGGDPEPHKPLKTVTGAFWADRRPRNGTVIQTRRLVRMVDGKARRRTQYLVQTVGYRAGGQPLRDTGKLAGSLSATGSQVGGKIVLTMRGRRYGLYQDRGFKTKGPNYIPLTLKGKRGHGTGQNPNREGLTRGKDFTMAWKGVTVPARPFILPTREDLKTLGVSIYLGLKSILKGK